VHRFVRNALIGSLLVAPSVALVQPGSPAQADSLGRPDTVLVSTAADGVSPANDQSDRPQISGDGRYVTFDSYATNLVSGTTTTLRRVYRKDMQTGTTIPISVFNNGTIGDKWSSYSYPSDDGNIVAFVSDTQRMAPVASFGRSVFVRDVNAGKTELISVSDAGKPANAAASRPNISGDGRFVTFNSKATNLSSLGGNGNEQVYLRDRVAHTTTLVSETTAGGLSNNTSYRGIVSGDGHYVLFASFATNLLSDVGQNGEGIYLRDMWTQTTTRVTTRLDGSPGTGSRPYMTPDGATIAFNSNDIYTLGDTPGTSDVFVWNAQTGFEKLAQSNAPASDPNGDSLRLFLSDDGRYAIFNSFANNLTANDGNSSGDVFFKDRQTGVITLLSLSWFGGAADAQSFRPVFSDDGSQVAFLSGARNLVQGDPSTQLQVYYMSSASVTAAGPDTTKPTLAGLLPTRGSTVATSPGQIQGTVSDDRLVDRVYVQIKDTASQQWLQSDGSFGSKATLLPATLDTPYTPSANWSYSANLPPGKYGYVVTAYDVSKNVVKSSQINFTGAG
jgi:Tol biopolymer transport system component